MEMDVGERIFARVRCPIYFMFHKLHNNLLLRCGRLHAMRQISPKDELADSFSLQVRYGSWLVGS